MTKKLLKTIAINGLVIVLFFLALEGVARLWSDRIRLSGTDDRLIQNNRYKDTPGLRPGARGISNEILYRVGSWGFWLYDHPKKVSRKSWLLLGDSVTMGVGVKPDSTFGGILHNRTDSINVLNSGLIGYASPNYKDVADVVLSKDTYHIERVLLFWTLNDIYRKIPGNDYPGKDFRFIAELKTFLRQNFKFYHLLKGLFFDRSKAYYQYDQSFYRKNSDQLEQAVDNLEAVTNAADRHGLPITIYLLPYEYQLRAREQKKNMFRPQKLLKQRLLQRETGVEGIVNCSTFFDSDKSRSYYLFGDGMHFSKKGHRVVYDCIQSTVTP